MNRTVPALASVIALAGLAATAAPADAAAPAGTSRPRAAAPTFRMTVATPARLASGASTAALSSTVVGITEAGVVAGNVADATGDAIPFVGSGWLNRAVRVDGTTRTATLRAVSTSGRLAGGAYGRAVRWDGGTPRVLAAGQPWESGQAVDAAGNVLGTSDHVYVDAMQRWDGRGVTVLTGPIGALGRVTGMADTGNGIATFTGSPHGDRNGVYPKAALLTTTSVVPFKASSNAALTADAISPNGAWVVGRTGAKGTEPTSVVRLSTSRTPQAIPGATAGFTPKDVNDVGQIVGAYRGHAAGWMDGKLYDLNTMTSMPRGWVLTDAVAITRKGDIAANATDPSGRTVAVKLTFGR